MNSEVSREFVYQRVVELIREVVGTEPELIDEDASIDGALEMNSVTFVELQVAIEEELDVILDPIEIVERNRLGDIIDYIYECTREVRA